MGASSAFFDVHAVTISASKVESKRSQNEGVVGLSTADIPLGRHLIGEKGNVFAAGLLTILTCHASEIKLFFHRIRDRQLTID